MSKKKISNIKEILIILIGTALFFPVVHIGILIYQRPLPIIPSGADVRMTTIFYNELAERGLGIEISGLVDRDEILEILSRYYYRRSLNGIFAHGGDPLWSINIWIGEEGCGIRQVNVGGGINTDTAVVARVRRGITTFMHREIDNSESLIYELNSVINLDNTP